MSTALFTGLYATRLLSDTEYKVQCLSSRRLALLDIGNELGILVSNATITPDPTDDLLCQAALFIVQDEDKNLESKMVELKTKIKEYKEMQDSALKRAKEDAKESFTISA
ncbi:MAG: hypothetical protein GX568_07105 [Candidatus Gastranaerophilales bacterium]|nr:hypothetical protein [Candidatus Gastranaerophilales bacterium]